MLRSPRSTSPKKWTVSDRIAAATIELMQYLATGKLQIIVGQTYPLAGAAEAHRAIAERKTTGKVVLLV